MSDTIKIILIIAVFVFFIYRKKFSAFLTKRKSKHTSEKSTEKGLAAVPPASAVEMTKDTPGSGGSGNIPKQCPAAPYRYEAYAFDYAQYPEAGHFADRISARLDIIETSMQDKKHYIKFIELGTCLLILVKYQD